MHSHNGNMIKANMQISVKIFCLTQQSTGRKYNFKVRNYL